MKLRRLTHRGNPLLLHRDIVPNEMHRLVSSIEAVRLLEDY
jgi:hypothetical protein